MWCLGCWMDACLGGILAIVLALIFFCEKVSFKEGMGILLMVAGALVMA